VLFTELDLAKALSTRIAVSEGQYDNLEDLPKTKKIKTKWYDGPSGSWESLSFSWNSKSSIYSLLAELDDICNTNGSTASLVRQSY